MNSTPQSIPGLKSLYWADFTIRRVMNVVAFGLLVTAGMQWASQPVASSAEHRPVDATFEASFAQWVSVGGLVMAALAVVILVRRYLLVKKILTHGAIIKGTVEDLHVFSRENDTENSIKRKPTYTRTHYATIRYACGETEKSIRLKLPGSGFTYSLVKGGETDLIVLDSAPNKPLIRSVYLGRS